MDEEASGESCDGLRRDKREDGAAFASAKDGGWGRTCSRKAEYTVYVDGGSTPSLTVTTEMARGAGRCAASSQLRNELSGRRLSGHRSAKKMVGEGHTFGHPPPYL